MLVGLDGGAIHTVGVEGATAVHGGRQFHARHKSRGTLGQNARVDVPDEPVGVFADMGGHAVESACIRFGDDGASGRACGHHVGVNVGGGWREGASGVIAASYLPHEADVGGHARLGIGGIANEAHANGGEFRGQNLVGEIAGAVFVQRNGVDRVGVLIGRRTDAAAQTRKGSHANETVPTLIAGEGGAQILLGIGYRQSGDGKGYVLADDRKTHSVICHIDNLPFENGA